LNGAHTSSSKAAQSGGLDIKYSGHSDKGGILKGFGNVVGASEVSGTIRAGRTIGTLTFEDRVLFATTSFYWTLVRLDDADAHAGVYWNALRFRGPAKLGAEGDGFFVLLHFQDVPDPDSSHPFWRREHRWLLAQFDASPYEWLVNSPRGNFVFAHGTFRVEPEGDHRAYLVYKPAPAH